MTLGGLAFRLSHNLNSLKEFIGLYKGYIGIMKKKMETTIVGYILGLYGWLSKLWSLLGTLNIRCRILIGIQRGGVILTNTHIVLKV